MPTLTHFLGPALIPGEGSLATRTLRDITITRELIRQLPPMTYFRQKMHKAVTDVVAFQVEGFETSAQFTHELRPAAADVLWRGLRDKTRNVARKAAKSYEVETGLDAAAFMRLYRENLGARRQRPAFSLDIAEQLIEASLARGCGQSFAVRAPGGAAKAAIFCVWDHATYYYLLSTRALDSGNGAITLLLWSAIQQAAARGLVFDFDGLGFKGSVLFYGGFGAEMSPRYIVTRARPSFNLMLASRRLLRPSSRFF